jgi:hypothetical protein
MLIIMIAAARACLRMPACSSRSTSGVGVVTTCRDKNATRWARLGSDNAALSSVSHQCLGLALQLQPRPRMWIDSERARGARAPKTLRGSPARGFGVT